MAAFVNDGLQNKGGIKKNQQRRDHYKRLDQGSVFRYAAADNPHHQNAAGRADQAHNQGCQQLGYICLFLFLRSHFPVSFSAGLARFGLNGMSITQISARLNSRRAKYTEIQRKTANLYLTIYIFIL